MPLPRPHPIPGTESGTVASPSATYRSPHAAAPSPAPAACYTLSCALNAGLVPAMEADMRRMLRSVRSLNDLRPLVHMLDLALRRPGCWPAMLAHADLRQVSRVFSGRSWWEGSSLAVCTEWGSPCVARVH